MSRSAVSRISFPVVASLIGVLVLLFAGIYLYDRSQRNEIAAGVKIGGIDVGGMSAATARAKIEQRLIAPLNRTVTVSFGGHSWRLSSKDAGLTVDAGGMVNQAVEASRQGSIFSRTVRGLFGGTVKREIPLQASYSHEAIRELTAKVRAGVNRSPRDANVQPSASGLQEIASEPGVAVDNASLARRVERALVDAGASRTVTVPTRSVSPAVSTSQLAAKYPAYIVIDRAAFMLRLYQHLRLASTYEIAVGMQGLETPPGLYHIQWKQVDPPWYVPNKAWAGKLAGKVIPPGPEDPLKARFMSFDGGAGIHGIDPSEYSSIGHDASHGCVRMRIPDVIALYGRTPVGTPVYIA
jgi:lipoprotein-anchoring transpeptidase ErfK/SrfK